MLGKALQICVCALISAAVLVSPASAEIQLTLKNSFIEKYKNRTSITDDCVVDHSKGKPNPASKDGDMHVAVRCSETALPLVAEIVNARDHPDAVDSAKTLEQNHQQVRITGAWRIWNEHSGGQVFVQGEPVAMAQNTNPDHVFEIHPISSFGDIDVSAGWKPIEGYDAKAALDAFNRYENTPSRIIPNKSTTTIISGGLGYNYVDFQMQLNETPFPVSDGSFAFAQVLDLEGSLIHRKRRMVFVKDTPPELAVRTLSEGDCLRVLGVPRLDLALVSWRAKHAKTQPAALNWSLPYEIIVVGVYDSPCTLE